MKALVINRFGEPEELQIQELGIPMLKAGEVLVRVHAAGINPVDYKIRNGSMKLITGKKFPRILGGDVAGVVEQAGERSAFRPGDKVFAMLSITGGAYAEFVCVKENQLCHIPEGFSMVEAAAVPLASLTALQAFWKGDGIKPGDSVLVNGASGGVGSFAVQIAKALDARVTAVCSTKNVDFVKSLGADKVIDYEKEDFKKLDEKFSAVFDAVAKSSFRKCKKLLTDDGKYVSTLPNNGLFLSQAFNFTDKKKAYFIGTKSSGHDLAIIAGFMKKHLLKPYIQQSFPLADGAEAHHLIETGRVRGKLVLKVIE
ncbi:MAG: NAD(P)-dependent alcohol dehydrogenase [Bacteroidales bacterium]|nr:NAD(P)-dependent alcohol dehydrogenase [Bacteroidales bacterium]